MNAVGDRIAIGAQGNDGNGSDAGHARFTNTPITLGTARQ